MGFRLTFGFVQSGQFIAFLWHQIKEAHNHEIACQLGQAAVQLESFMNLLFLGKTRHLVWRTFAHHHSG